MKRGYVVRPKANEDLDAQALYYANEVSLELGHLQCDTTTVPTILVRGPYRLYFYSHEPNEPPHVHVDRDEDSAKFWLDPVCLSKNLGFTPMELHKIQRVVEDNQSKLLEKWYEYFPA